MEYSPKIRMFRYGDRELRLCNQSCPEWTHPYNYPPIPSEANDNLHTAGCGIFAMSHVIDYFTGRKENIEELADFVMATGGRGDDGTDRPVMLDAMQKAGKLTDVGFRYDGDGCINDHDALWANLEAGGAALCDLRFGHIVAIVDKRVINGEKQVLIIDSSRDSVHPSVRGDVREVVKGTEVYSEYINSNGVRTGMAEHYAMFWVPLSKPYDFNLLHRI